VRLFDSAFAAYTRLVSEAFRAHLERPVGKGHTPRHAFTGAAGGAACGDLVRVSLSVDPHDPEGRISDAGFDASGCGASVAAGSAAVALVKGQPLLMAARVGVGEISGELGGLSDAKTHAAELAGDALHRALGAAAKRQATLRPRPGRALVAMSGGVDSAVAALIALGQSEDVVAVTLELWADPDNDGERSCCSAQAVRGARSLAHRLGVPHLSLDLRPEFRAGVVEPWLAEHAAGRTPYPCVRCNGSVRLDGMLDLAARVGAGSLVTGHYARTADAGDGLPLLRMAADRGKDQSYALAALSRESLARMRFPLGDLTKDQVRALAGEAELEVARRPDSQDLCFLAGTTQREFLARHGGLRERPGEIVAADGRVLGRHRGAHAYTIGQRHGLGVGGGEPLYVLATDTVANTVTVGARERLTTETIAIEDAVLHRDGGCVDAVKIRYRGRPLPCALQGTPAAGAHRRLTVRTPRPLERTAAGQLACLYSGEVVVGQGTIAG
jgi:tRNA-specific 2-thiouridylase